MEIMLKNPIQKEGKELCILTLREPRLKDYKVFERLKFDESGADISMGDMLATAKQAAETLGNLTPLEAGEIALPDAMRISEAVMGFFEKSETTGGAE